MPVNNYCRWYKNPSGEWGTVAFDGFKPVLIAAE